MELIKDGYIEISGGCEVYAEAKIAFSSKGNKIKITVDNKGGYFWIDNDNQLPSFTTKINGKLANDFLYKLNSILDNKKETQSISTRNATVKIYLPFKEKTVDIKWNEFKGADGKIYEMDPLLDLIDEFIQKTSNERTINRDI